MSHLLCWLGRHDWAAVDDFKAMPVRQCQRPGCGRFEHRLFLASRWTRAPHLDGMSEAQRTLWGVGRRAEREQNDEWRRAGDRRAIW